VVSKDADPIRLPDEVWRTATALRMLRSRDFRAIFRLAQIHNIGIASIALKAGLPEDLLRKVASGDAKLTSAEQVERTADALSMPALARAALGLPPPTHDPVHMRSDFWNRAAVTRALAGWDVPGVLAAIISERNWSQHQLADVLGYSQSWVSNVMRGAQSLTVNQARTILLQFGAPLHQLTISHLSSENKSRREQAAGPEVVTRWTGGLASALRAAWSLSAEEFAEKLGVSVSVLSACEADPRFVLPFSMQQILGMTLDQAPDYVKARFGHLRDSDVVNPENTHSEHDYEVDARGDVDEIQAVADEAEVEELFLLAEPGTAAITVLRDESTEIARSGNRAPREIFTVASRIRSQTLKLADRTRRPSALAELYAIAGVTTALMASAAFDLNQWNAAATLARSAGHYGTLAGDPSLEAWTLGLSALIANWRNEPDIALSHFRHGLQVAPSGTQMVRLRLIAARSFALLGDSLSVAEVLEEARRDQDNADRVHDGLSDGIAGEFAFGRARAEACAAAAWLDLGCGIEAKQAARRALDQFLSLPSGRQPFSQLTGARIDLATACLLEHERDEAGAVLNIVLTVPAEMRNASLAGRLTRTRRTLTSDYWSKDQAVRDLDKAILEWQAGNL
jgi:transcriptional regulator with XRE-family HTH domain